MAKCDLGMNKWFGLLWSKHFAPFWIDWCAPKVKHWVGHLCNPKVVVRSNKMWSLCGEKIWALLIWKILHIYDNVKLYFYDWINMTFSCPFLKLNIVGVKRGEARQHRWGEARRSEAKRVFRSGGEAKQVRRSDARRHRWGEAMRSEAKRVFKWRGEAKQVKRSEARRHR